MKEFEVFICYKRYSADDFAKRLKEALGDYGISAFVDFVDIPKKYEFTAKWWESRDQAVRDCETFAMIVTVGFEKSQEIIKEIRLAREDEKKTYMCFRYSGLKPELIMNLGDESVNAKDWEQIEFTEAGELVRKFFDHYHKGEEIPTKAGKVSEEKAIHAMKPTLPSQTKPSPIVHFEITQAVGGTTIQRRFPDVGFNIRNWSDKPIRAFVKARVLLGEKDLGLIEGGFRAGKYIGYYDGKTPWNLNPYNIFFGHFTVPHEAVVCRETLTIEVSVSVRDLEGNEFVYLPVGWTYIRDKNQWFAEPTEFS
jgi:hypothetical protein